MPKFVDHDLRRYEIIVATTNVLAREGLKGLSLNAVAKQLGGTVTMITHYYASKSELINDLAERMIMAYEQELDEIESGVDDALARLHTFLEWALPLTDEGMIEERQRIRLIADCDEIPAIRAMFTKFDVRMREFIREHLRPLVEPKDLEDDTELLRVVTTGLCLAAVENQKEWPEKRQIKVLNRTLSLLGLGQINRE